MKISILLSLLILAVAGVFAWQGELRLVEVRKAHREVVEAARGLGISVEVGEEGGPASKTARRDREGREDVIKTFAAELVAFAKRMEEAERGDGGSDEELEKEMMEIMRRFLELNPAQLKELIAEFKVNTEIEDEMREEIIGFSIMMLATDSPEAALALYVESAETLDENGVGEEVVASALGQWAESDPLAALAWIRENGEKHPEMVTDDAKVSVISGAARQDIALAFRLMDELDLEHKNDAIEGIARAATTPEGRLELLGIVRGLANDRDGIAGRALSELGSQITKSGFDKTIAWLEQAELSDGERDQFLFGDADYQLNGEETGKWLEWMGSEMSDERGTKRLGNMMRAWTRKDFRAAGKWLGEAEDGPTKETALNAYAETVAPYEPDAAAQWALTMPEGPKREELIKKIHAEWKKKDEAAAAVFAAEQGIE